MIATSKPIGLLFRATGVEHQTGPECRSGPGRASTSRFGIRPTAITSTRPNMARRKTYERGDQRRKGVPNQMPHHEPADVRLPATWVCPRCNHALHGRHGWATAIGISTATGRTNLRSRQPCRPSWSDTKPTRYEVYRYEISTGTWFGNRFDRRRGRNQPSTSLPAARDHRRSPNDLRCNPQLQCPCGAGYSCRASTGLPVEPSAASSSPSRSTARQGASYGRTGRHHRQGRAGHARQASCATKRSSTGDGMFDALKHLRDRFRRDERGAVLVEMTLITPLMILLSAGVFEFGNFIHQKLLMEAGLNDAARYAARCNSQSTQADLRHQCAEHRRFRYDSRRHCARCRVDAAGCHVQPRTVSVRHTTPRRNTVLYRSNNGDQYAS